MKIPENLGTIKDLKQRESKAHNRMGKWESTLEEVYEYFLPQRNLFNSEAKGQKKTDKNFDSTPIQAIQTGASKLQASIAPIWARWANFEPSEQIIELLESGQYNVSEVQIRENLEKQAEVVFDYINRSNFGTQFFEMSLDLLVGTGSLMIDEDDSDEMPIVFNSVPQKGIAFEEGPLGTIETHWRRFTVKGRHIERKWQGFEVSQELAAKIKDDPDCEVETREGVIYDPKDNKYYGVVWVKGEEKISWLADFEDSSAWVTGRYAKTSGEVRGRGPSLQCIADVKTLNKAKEFAFQKAGMDLAGMWTATDDGTLNPYTIQIQPGIVIPVGSNNSQNPSLARLDNSTDLNLSLFVIEDLQASIKKAHFNNLREPTDTVITLGQYLFEARELQEAIGSAFGRLQTEVLIPILKRVVWILTRRGLIQPIKIGGKEVTIKFTSPLAKAQDLLDLDSVKQAVAFTLETAGPDQAKMAYKLEDFGTWAAKKTGMPQELVRDEGEKAKIIQAGAEAAQAGLPTSSEQVA
ncbi:MAG: hypothetical protein GY829_12460 [Gammaproteobacteria bacterium]|nr:hypothetical protein [Gammaproteobacteria bacterium]